MTDSWGPWLRDTPRVASAAMWPARDLREESFAWIWEDLAFGEAYAEERTLLRTHVEGKLMLDLGSGQPMAARALATSLHAAAYAGVDLNHPLGHPASARQAVDAASAVWGLPCMAVRADIMEVLCHLRAGPHAVVIGGIDQDIVPDLNWHTHLATQLLTVCSGGVAFCTESTVMTTLVKRGATPMALQFCAAQNAATEALGGSWLGTAVLRLP